MHVCDFQSEKVNDIYFWCITVSSNCTFFKTNLMTTGFSFLFFIFYQQQLSVKFVKTDRNDPRKKQVDGINCVKGSRRKNP